MIDFTWERYEIAFVLLALCMIVVVMAFARSRDSVERQLKTALARWEEELAQVNERLAACEAQLAERSIAGSGVPSEPDDEEITAWLESLRGLIGSMQTSKSPTPDFVAPLGVEVINETSKQGIATGMAEPNRT